MWPYFVGILCLVVSPVWADDLFGISGGTTSRLWMSSPYLNHQTHKAIIQVLRDAGYEVHDHTPPEMNPNRPPVTAIRIDATGRFYEIGAEPVTNPPLNTRARDGFPRRNGVVNGYDYRASVVGMSPQDYFQFLKRTFNYDMDIKTTRNGGLVAIPAMSGFSIEDFHTFAAVPQNDESVVLNHLYRSVLQTALNQGYRTVQLEFERATGEIRFRIR